MKIICVDDEQMALDEIKDVMSTIPETEGADFFLSPLKALEWLDTHKADAAFLDIKMRQMDGLSMAKAIKEKQPQCAIIFVSGYDKYAISAFRLHASGYLLKPYTAEDVKEELKHIKTPQEIINPRGRIRAVTFGNFEFYIDDVAVKFKRSKTKELLAYLIDRSGSASTAAEICARLWEDKAVENMSYLRHLISDLKKTLDELDAKDVFINGRNSYAINPNVIECDAYSFRQSDIEAINSYTGEYMSQYTWAELTAGEFASVNVKESL